MGTYNELIQDTYSSTDTQLSSKQIFAVKVQVTLPLSPTALGCQVVYVYRPKDKATLSELIGYARTFILRDNLPVHVTEAFAGHQNWVHERIEIESVLVAASTVPVTQGVLLSEGAILSGVQNFPVADSILMLDLAKAYRLYALSLLDTLVVSDAAKESLTTVLLEYLTFKEFLFPVGVNEVRLRDAATLYSTLRAASVQILSETLLLSEKLALYQELATLTRDSVSLTDALSGSARKVDVSTADALTLAEQAGTQAVLASVIEDVLETFERVFRTPGGSC